MELPNEYTKHIRKSSVGYKKSYCGEYLGFDFYFTGLTHALNINKDDYLQVCKGCQKAAKEAIANQKGTMRYFLIKVKEEHYNTVIENENPISFDDEIYCIIEGYQVYVSTDDAMLIDRIQTDELITELIEYKTKEEYPVFINSVTRLSKVKTDEPKDNRYFLFELRGSQFNDLDRGYGFQDVDALFFGVYSEISVRYAYISSNSQNFLKEILKDKCMQCFTEYKTKEEYLTAIQERVK